MTDITSETLKGLLEKATSWPWELEEYGRSEGEIEFVVSGKNGGFITNVDQHGFDARLVTISPSLAQEVLNLREENERLRVAIKTFVAEAPIGDDDEPYCSEVMQSDFKALRRALTRKE